MKKQEIGNMRHEDKYICSGRQLVLIRTRLQSVMQIDPHQKGENYRIRSLYLDTASRRFYEESMNGVDDRKKYRIRFYDLDDRFLRIERKDTVGGMKEKVNHKTDRDSVDLLLAGETVPFSDGLIGQIHNLQVAEGLRPMAIIDYIRCAYTYPTGNVRITFDTNLACSGHCEDLFRKDAVLLPLLPQDRFILEVKYDAILPGFISKMLDIGDLERVSFSKYVYAINILNGNGRSET